MNQRPTPHSVSQRNPAIPGGTIGSVRNPRVKHVIKLRRRAHRDSERLMIIEGGVELKRALDNGILPVSLFCCEEFCSSARANAIIRQCMNRGVEIIDCTASVFSKMAYRDQSDGLIGIAPQFRHELDRFIPSPVPLIIVAESIEKPGNLGAILRSADGAGADAVIVCDSRTDIYNPNVVRSSMGTIFSLPVINTTSRTALSWLRGHEILILAATPGARKEYTEADLSRGSAIVVGEEHEGLSELWMRESDMKLRIPMRGQADSLNVASAATILLFEAVRQREKERSLAE